MKNKYIVKVTNLGIYSFTNKKTALKAFSEYKHQSEYHKGEASGEDVYLYANGETVKYWFGYKTSYDN